MTLTIKVGKRYVRDNKTISHPLKASGDPDYPFLDGATTITKSGQVYQTCKSDYDLVSEYKPAKPEWRVVIQCESRDMARMVKKELIGFVNMDKITVEKSS